MATLPGALALASIADGALAIAADLRNNYTAVQTYANDLRTLLAGGTTGQVLTSGGTTTVSWAAPTGPTTYRNNTLQTLNTTTTLTSILSQSIGAGVMGTTGMLKVRLFGDFLNNSGANRGWQLKIVFGGTTLWDATLAAAEGNSATRKPFAIEFLIANQGAANSQNMNGELKMGQAVPSAPTTGIGGIVGGVGSLRYSFASNGVTAVDTASAQTLDVSWAHEVSSASLEIRRYGWLIELV